MIRAAIVGLGWWGQTLVEAVSGVSEVMRFTAGTTRTKTDNVREFAGQHSFKLYDDYEAVLADSDIDAVVLATPHSMHISQIKAAARAGKHVFAEKPMALTKAEAEEAIAAVREAGITFGLGYNRRFHPEMIGLKERIARGDLGKLLHFEAAMCAPNGLLLKRGAWRADPSETPCGGLTPMGVHSIDAAIDLFGDVAQVYCQSMSRAVEVDSDDTTSVLFKMKDGMTGYLSCILATAPLYRLQIFGSGGWVRYDGKVHVAGTSSEERRSQLFGTCEYKPVKGEGETWNAEALDLSRACLEAFAQAASGGKPYPISFDQMIHGAAVTEAIVKSAETNLPVKVA